MTIHAWWFLRKLKKAQIHLDGQVGIDPERLTAVTVHRVGDPYKEINIKSYADCLDATFDYLQEQGCLDFEDQELVKVTYAGWHLFSATLAGTFRGIVLDVIIPVVVSVIAAAITTKLMNS